MSQERDDLLESLRKHRGFLIYTTRDLTDAQAALRPTASELCLGGLVKHVTLVERRWADFIIGGAEQMNATPVDWMDAFQMTGGDTLASLLSAYAARAAETDNLVESVDLDQVHPLPAAPWYEPGAAWSVRRVLLHIVAETAQHAGHADILRESIDGSKTMG